MPAAPLFLLAPGRCFSSLICAMLGQHPQLYALPETQLLVRDTMGEWLRDFGWGIHSHGLVRAIAEVIFGGQTAGNVRRARSWLEQRKRASTADVLFELMAQLRPLLLVEKTPMLTYRPSHMERARQLFPDARFLHVVRHPAGYGRSLLEYFRHRAPLDYPRRVADMLANRESIFFKLFDPKLDPPDFDPQHAWLLRHDEVTTFTASLQLGTCLLVRAEELLANPIEGLREVCDWLDLDNDPEAINEMLHPERAPFGCFGPPGARFGADPKFLAKPVLRSQRERLPPLDAPMPWSPTGATFARPVRELATKIGYA